jgi:hypothetical protein
VEGGWVVLNCPRMRTDFAWRVLDCDWYKDWLYGLSACLVDGLLDERDADYTDYADFGICWIVPCKILTPPAPKISYGRFWLIGLG